MLADDAWWHQVVDFSDYGLLLGLVQYSIIAAGVLGVVGGVLGVLVMQRDMAFAVHGVSELSFAGAAAALLIGTSVVAGAVVGSLVAGLAIGLLGARARDRNSAIGVLMPFGLGLGILFLALYDGRASSKFGLLTGQIVSVDGPQLYYLIGICVFAAAVLVAIWRPLLFDSLDPDVAAARGVPRRMISLVFMGALGLVVAVAVQIVGALLVLALLVTPAAAALRVSSSLTLVPFLAALFGVTAAVGGILLALGGSLPISPYITTISFVIYLVARLVGAVRDRAAV
ncbi:metal ABC transporter permease [Nocardioides bruguierae]|uniref:Metal ABC transporter permease n=1 Tax=Nocardioides bruguierae TaxID=2945102 RepID=A0A9X2IDQ4_9ACTN|nr:metal ABC transporter permease [Nocardioides bruguierae]MCL8024865.1 metal ABC transporter permease [Nocardioides bruguierae]MCM0619268.1 metal ABC transporter permease [Nocardioides bruguierae]